MILSPPGSEYSPQAWILTEVPPENLDGDWKTSWFRERLVPDRCYKACLENIGKYHFFKGNCCGLALWGFQVDGNQGRNLFPRCLLPPPPFFFREVFVEGSFPSDVCNVLPGSAARVQENPLIPVAPVAPGL